MITDSLAHLCTLFQLFMTEMSPLAKRRRLSPTSPIQNAETITADVPLAQTMGENSPNATQVNPALNQQCSESEPGQDPAISPTKEIIASKSNSNDRAARFAALKKRATASARANLVEAKSEAQRAAVDPSVLANLSRRSAIAQHNLLKADTEEEHGSGAFERKRAWDYTVEESERWDERMARKKEAREKNAFQDYGAEAAKIYERQIRELEKAAKKDGGLIGEEYLRQKAELIEQAAKSGGLEIVEMENGELVAIDRDGRFYADSDNTGFVEQKPKKENVDRLVEDIRKAEEVRLKKRKDRRGEPDDGDVTYINEKNKQFNLKLARFYDRYTSDIRESFERGTAV